MNVFLRGELSLKAELAFQAKLTPRRIKGFWWWGSQQGFGDVLAFADGLGCNSFWFWNPTEEQVNQCLMKGWMSFVVVGSGQQVDWSLVDKWKSWDVVLAVDDWRGGSEPLRQLRLNAPSREVAIGTYGADLLGQVNPSLYEYAFLVLYPIYQNPPRNRIEWWSNILKEMRNATSKKLVAWIQAFAGGALNWAMPTADEFKTILDKAAEAGVDGVLVFLPKRFPPPEHPETMTDDFMSHPELYQLLEELK